MAIHIGHRCPFCNGEFDDYGRRVPCDHCGSTGGIYELQEDIVNTNLKTSDKKSIVKKELETVSTD